MNLSMIGGTDQQRRWFEDTVAQLSFPTELILANVSVVWVDEPPCPGHSDTACTQVTGANAVISVRNTLDQRGKLVYADNIAHELGHVYHFTRFSLAERQAQTADWEYGRHTGELRVGTAADLNPLDALWADRIQEAWAEVWKDTFLKASARSDENRSNWRIDKAGWARMFGGETGVNVTAYTQIDHTQGVIG